MLTSHALDFHAMCPPARCQQDGGSDKELKSPTHDGLKNNSIRRNLKIEIGNVLALIRFGSLTIHMTRLLATGIIEDV